MIPVATKKKLKILEEISILNPCTEDWNKMSGGNKVKFCNHCQKNVYNLAKMSKPEAIFLLLKKRGKCCLRIEKTKDGSLLFQQTRILRNLFNKVSSIGTAFLLFFSQTAFSSLAFAEEKKGAVQTVQANKVLAEEGNISKAAKNSGQNQKAEKERLPCHQAVKEKPNDVFFGGGPIVVGQVGNLLRLIEGAAGALVMLSSFILGIVAAIARYKKTAIGFFILALFAFVLRLLVSLFFGTDLLKAVHTGL